MGREDIMSNQIARLTTTINPVPLISYLCSEAVCLMSRKDASHIGSSKVPTKTGPRTVGDVIRRLEWCFEFPYFGEDDPLE